MTAPRFVRALVAPAPGVPGRTDGSRLAPRPALTLVPDAKVLRARRLSRLFAAITCMAICFGLFGVVGVHVMLAQGQSDVQRLESTVQKLHDEHQALAMQANELEAPARIVATARGELGMVVPAQVATLGSADLAHPPETTIPGPKPTTTVATTVATTAATTAATTVPTSASTSAETSPSPKTSPPATRP